MSQLNLNPLKVLKEGLFRLHKRQFNELKQMSLFSKSCNNYLKNNHIDIRLRIIIPTTFNLSKDWWIHDGIIASALRIRGVEVIPTSCNGIQSFECLNYSGEWQTFFINNKGITRDSLCGNCSENSRNLWKIWGLSPVLLTDYLDSSDKNEIDILVRTWMKGDWENVEFEGFPCGREAYKAVINNEMQGDIQQWWRDKANKLAEFHLKNILSLIFAYKKIFTKYSPDRVFGNGGYYYQWGVPFHLARLNKISYYNYYHFPIHNNKDLWTYGYNTKVFFDFLPAFPSYVIQPWTEKHESIIIDYFKNIGIDLSNISSPQKVLNEKLLECGVDLNRPIAILAGGVAWDATSSGKSPIFNNINEFVIETIKWFIQNPQFYLIIRPHPAEMIMPEISPNRTTLVSEIEKSGINISDNIYIIDRESSISTYDLISIAKVGVVYTSTIGAEMSIFGLPTIITGPAPYAGCGFTYEPDSKNTYFDILSTLLENYSYKEVEKNQILAKKFWYFFQYHVNLEMGKIMKQILNKKNPDVTDILPGSNKYIDYICDCIILNKPIFDINRWPPKRK